MIWAIFYGYLPERFEVPRNFFRIRILLLALAVFSLILFSGIFVKSPMISLPFWTIQILKAIEDCSFRPFFLCWFEIWFPKFVPSSKIQLTRHLTRRTIKSSYRYRLMMFKILKYVQSSLRATDSSTFTADFFLLSRFHGQSNGWTIVLLDFIGALKITS